MIYRILFKLLFQPMDAEKAHDFAFAMLRIVTTPHPIRMLLRRITAPADPHLEVHALGQTFPSPLGVAGGMDKNARSFTGLWSLGFGHVEVGTITRAKQNGEDRPRLIRITRDRAVVNKMGFPNPGADLAAKRVGRRDPSIIVGLNVGKSKSATPEEAADDYRASVRVLAPVADYIVINVSSPNTPGLRDMQAVGILRPLVAEVREELEETGIGVPMLIKIGPDLADNDIDAVADLALELELDGIIAVNTTVERSGLTHASSEQAEALPGGGVSGAPLAVRSMEVLRRLRARVGERLVLVSVGGIETPDDVWKRILAGATLVQTHTGFMYGGPAWPRKVNRELSRRVRESGYGSIQQAIGAESTNGWATNNGSHGSHAVVTA